MSNKIHFEWEKIGENYTSRAKVIGGWIICHNPRRKDALFDEDGENIGTGLVFISDPNHMWEIGREKKSNKKPLAEYSIE